MRIRLHGTPPETTATLTELEKVLNIHNISRPYPDRTPSQLHRIYLDAEPRKAGEEPQ